jgi:hypothetical protein
MNEVFIILLDIGRQLMLVAHQYPSPGPIRADQELRIGDSAGFVQDQCVEREVAQFGAAGDSRRGAAEEIGDGQQIPTQALEIAVAFLRLGHQRVESQGQVVIRLKHALP